METKQKPKLLKKLDLAILLCVLGLAIFYSGSVYAKGYQAQGEDAEIYIDSGGLAFQGDIRSFIALYTPIGALNSTENEFFISDGGSGRFSFVSNENFSLQFLKSVPANIEGDQGNPPRAINATETGLSGLYPVNSGNRVTIYWTSPFEYPLAVPIITFWGFVGGAIITPISLAGAIKKRNLKLLWISIGAGIFALICLIIMLG